MKNCTKYKFIHEKLQKQKSKKKKQTTKILTKFK